MTVLKAKEALLHEVYVDIRLDKITITLDPPEGSHLQLIAKMKEEAAYYAPGTKWYRHFARFPLHELNYKYSDSSRALDLVVCASPRAKNARFARIEFNPGRVEAQVPAYYLGAVFGIGWDDVCLGEVTNLHIAVDVHGVPIESLQFHAPKFQATRVITKNGKTVYVGGATSARSFCCYDKVAEIRHHNRNVPESLRQEVPSHPVTRIEARLKPKVRLAALCDLANPYRDVTVAALGEGNHLPWYLQLAAKLADFTSVNAVMPMLPKAQRAEYLALQKKAVPAWWNPTAIWEGFPPLADALINPLLAKAA